MRSFSSQTTAFLSKPRTIVTKTPTSLRAQQWQVSSFQRRFASDEASPAQAKTTDETVPIEPSKSEQEATRESSLEVDADAAKPESKITQATSAVSETAQNAAETIKETAASTAEAVQEQTRNAATAILGEHAATADVGTFTEPKAGKILYVGNLFFEVRAQDLEREFSRVGEVVNCRIAQDPKGLSKGYVFCRDMIDSKT